MFWKSGSASSGCSRYRSVKLREEVEPRLEVVAREPRLDVREPRLLPDEQDRVLADRLQERGKQKQKMTRQQFNERCLLFKNYWMGCANIHSPQKMNQNEKPLCIKCAK